jgi:hypothetical protein
VIANSESETRAWVAATSRATQARTGPAVQGEEWISLPGALVTGATAYIDALRGAADDRSPPARLRAQRGDLLTGYRAEVWMQREASFSGLADRHRARPSTGRVSLALGAGKIASIAALAVLHELFAQGSVVVAKLDPVEVSVRQSLERVFLPPVSAGFVRFAHGRGDVR